MIKQRNHKEIWRLANKAIKFVESLDALAKGDPEWTEQLPIWKGQDSDRGLSSWGERISKDCKRKQRWVVKGICRQIILRAIDFYCDVIGTPPVITGVPPSAGHVQKKKRQKKTRYGHGFQKATPELVLGTPEETINTLYPFFFTLHIYYCTHLDPPVEQGTAAEVAVLKTIIGANCKNHLLRSIKTRFQVTHDMRSRHAPTTCDPRHVTHDM